MTQIEQENFIEMLRRAIGLGGIEDLLPFGLNEALKIYLDEVVERVQDPNKKIILSNLAVTPEIYYALDILPLVQEAFSGAAGLLGQTLKAIDAAVEAGIPDTELCNWQKIWLGMMASDSVPRPDMLVFAPEPCDSMNLSYQVIQNLYDVPTFGFDIPYWTHDKDSAYYDDSTLEYMGNQVQKMVDFLEKQANVKLDLDKLIDVVKLSNITRQNFLDIIEFQKMVPCPYSGFDLMWATSLSVFILGGTEQSARITTIIREEVESRVKNKQGYISLNNKKRTEKLRTLWLLLPPFSEIASITNWMERKYGCVNIANILGIFLTPTIDTSSQESIYQDLGRCMLDIPMARQYRGPIEYFLDDITRICKEYKIDGVILGGHNCKNVFAVRKLIADTLEEEAGVKTIDFEADAADPRVVSTQKVKKILGVFLDRLTKEKFG